MVYKINTQKLESECLEILKNRLERALLDREGIIHALDAAFAYKEAKRILSPHITDIAELDNTYKEIIIKLSKQYKKSD